MSPRDATLADYQWLYEHTNYMREGGRARATECLLDIIDQLPATLVDVGGGYGEMVNWLLQKTICTVADVHDPARDRAARFPTYDLVTCLDVLEHLQPAHVEAFIRNDLGRYSPRRMYLTICTDPEVREVNGEQVTLHTCIAHPNWWHAQIDHALPEWLVRIVPCAQKSRHLFIVDRP